MVRLSVGIRFCIELDKDWQVQQPTCVVWQILESCGELTTGHSHQLMNAELIIWRRAKNLRQLV